MKYNTLLHVIWIMGVFILVLVGCSAPKTIVKPPLDNGKPVIEKESVKETAVEKIESEEDIASDWPKFDESQFPLMASLPEDDIGLYSIKGSGMVLKIHENGFFYPWKGGLAPAEGFPRMYIGDYDSDGHKEIAVVLCAGRGTGVSLEELHILELNGLEENTNQRIDLIDEGKVPTENVYSIESIQKVLNRKVKISPVGAPKDLEADVKVDGAISRVQLKFIQNDQESIFLTDGGAGNIIMYEFNQNSIRVQFCVDVSSNTTKNVEIVGYIDANVEYMNGTFKLGNMKFTPYDECLIRPIS